MGKKIYEREYHRNRLTDRTLNGDHRYTYYSINHNNYGRAWCEFAIQYGHFFSYFDSTRKRIWVERKDRQTVHFHLAHKHLVPADASFGDFTYYEFVEIDKKDTRMSVKKQLTTFDFGKTTKWMDKLNSKVRRMEERKGYKKIMEQADGWEDTFIREKVKDMSWYW